MRPGTATVPVSALLGIGVVGLQGEMQDEVGQMDSCTDNYEDR